MKHPDTLFLFDVDGTLTLPRQRIDENMLSYLKSLRELVSIGFIGGSNLEKQKEQINDQILDLFDYSLPENGLIYYRNGKKVNEKTMLSHLGEEKLQGIINNSLKYLSGVVLPFKRGTFIEYRTGLLNVAPPGRSCSLKERHSFFEYDKQHGIRSEYCKYMKSRHPDIAFSIGGQISIDVFPNGWDKTYCLRHLMPNKLKNHDSSNVNSISTNAGNDIKGIKTGSDSTKAGIKPMSNIPERCSAGNQSVTEEDPVCEIFFFGDMILPGQNDYELMVHPLVTGIGTKGPEMTRQKCTEILWQKGWVKEGQDIE